MTIVQFRFQIDPVNPDGSPVDADVRDRAIENIKATATFLFEGYEYITGQRAESNSREQDFAILSVYPSHNLFANIEAMRSRITTALGVSVQVYRQEALFMPE